MAHGLEKNDTMFSAQGITPWHKLGTVLEKAPDLDQALILAGITYDVGKRPCAIVESRDGIDPESIIVGSAGNFVGDVAPIMATYRKDTGDILGWVGQDYQVIDSRPYIADLYQSIVTPGHGEASTGGTIFGGAEQFFTFKLSGIGDRDVRKNDAVTPYVLFHNGFDGKRSIHVGFTPIRVVCNNTLTAAIGGNKLFKVKHTKGAADRVSIVIDSMDMIRASFEMTVDQWIALDQKPIRAAQLAEYVRIVFNTKDTTQTVEAGEDMTGSRLLPKIEHLFSEGKGNQGRTWWDALNGVTEYLTHDRGSDDARRLSSNTVGDGARLNAKALKTALTLSGASV